MRLAEVAAQAPFPLYAIDPRHWSGEVYVGDVDRIDGRVVEVAIVYEDRSEARGAAVSNLDAAVRAPDAMDRHLVGFVSRYDPRFVERRTKRRKRLRFPDADFARETLLVPTGLGELGAELLRHRRLPLQVLRMAPTLGRSVTDVAIASWDTTARDLGALLEPVTARLAAAIDALTEGPDHPPPEWEAPGTLGEP